MDSSLVTTVGAGGAEDVFIGGVHASREYELRTVRRRKRWDLVVVGGGLQGSAIARAGALNGLSTLLLEARDYGAGSTGISAELLHPIASWMLRGSLADMGLHFRGLRQLTASAPHLTRQASMRFETASARSVFGKIKESYYAAVVMSRLLGYRPAASAYIEPVIDSRRLLIEQLLAARQEGASALNYARVDSIGHERNGDVVLGWRDLLAEERHEARAGIVVNCTGSKAPNLGRMRPSSLARELSEETYWYTDVADWTDGAGIVEFDFRARRLCACVPLLAGARLLCFGYQSREDAKEALGRLAERCRLGGLPEVLHTAVATASKGAFAAPQWRYSEGVLHLLGGGHAASSLHAEQCLRRIAKLAHLKRRLSAPRGRKLPGAGMFETAVREFKERARAHGVPAHLERAALARFGSRVRFFDQFPNAFDPIEDALLVGEVYLAGLQEQAQTPRDILIGRLGLSEHRCESLQEKVRDLCWEGRPDFAS